MKKEKKEKKPMKLWLKIILIIVIIIAALAAAFAILLLILTIREYNPADKESLDIGGKSSEELAVGDDLTVMTWNVGYAALGETADFWMDGGKSVMSSSKDEVQNNIASIADEVKAVDPDVAYFQEVDVDATRSYHIDEVNYLQKHTHNYQNTFATNFLVDFIPVPIPPMGKEDAGILTMSKYAIDNSTRYQLPCPFSWPSRIVNLKRCLMVDRVKLANSDKEIVFLNLHLEAYDSGAGKIAQTKMLREMIEKETAKGNYVVAAGDFNQIFSNVESPFKVNDGKWVPGVINTKDFDDSLQFVMDNKTASCRSLDKAYKGADKKNFQFYIIDGFIVSGNITVNSVETQDLQFQHSDHNPVVISLTLNKE